MRVLTLVISSFPRSGSHYIEHILKGSMDINIMRAHPLFNSFSSNPSDDNKIRKLKDSGQPIITIIRDPKESIPSIISLTEYMGLNQSKNYMPLYKPFSDEEINTLVLENEFNFINGLEFIQKQADIIIRFESLISNPESIINLISQKYNIPIISYQTSKKTWSDDPEAQSSTGHSRYQHIKSITNQIDLSKCYNVYRKIYENATI